MYDIFEQLLQERGLTAYAVSKATGIRESTLSNWKTRKSSPRKGTLIVIAKYFGVSVEYLMGKTTERYENKPDPKSEAELTDEEYDFIINYYREMLPDEREAFRTLLKKGKQRP